MKAILQRVASASVTVDSRMVSSIGKGVLVFAAVDRDDTRKDVESMASKVLKMKMWPDEDGATWKQNVKDIQGEVLCVSQFTLLASTKKGSKPDFHGAASPEYARELYDQFYEKIQELYDVEKVKNGVFQAMMDVNIQNSGPVSVEYSSLDEAVTLEINTNPRKDSPCETSGKQNVEQSKGTGEEMVEESGSTDDFAMPPELLS